MKKGVGLVSVLAMVMLLAGCSKVTKENYDKLGVGMDYEEVVTILGEPENCKDVLGTRSCEWGNDSKNISVKFVADKAALYSSNGL